MSLLVTEAGVVARLLAGARMVPHLVISIEPFGQQPLVANQDRAPHVEHPGVIFLQNKIIDV